MSDPAVGGLFAALKNIAATLLAGSKTRLELLGNEIEEEKQRALYLFVMAQAMLFCCGVGVLLAVAFLTALFWDNRLLVLGASCALFLVLAWSPPARHPCHRPWVCMLNSYIDICRQIG